MPPKTVSGPSGHLQRKWARASVHGVLWEGCPLPGVPKPLTHRVLGCVCPTAAQGDREREGRPGQGETFCGRGGLGSSEGR